MSGTGNSIDRLAAQAAPEYFRTVDRGDSTDPIAGSAEAVVRAHVELALNRPTGRILTRVHRSDGIAPSLQIVVDDMPLLVESLLALLGRLGIVVGELVHPVMQVRRAQNGTLVEIGAAAQASPSERVVAESWIHVHLDPHTARDVLDVLAVEIVGVLEDVAAVVHDGDAMRRIQLDLADDVADAALPATVGEQERSDCTDLLRWMADGNFTLLGYHRLARADELGADGHRPMVPVRDSGLGLLRSRVDDGALAARDAVRDGDSRLLVLTEGSAPATVHRAAYPFFAGVAVFGTDGAVIGEHRFLGVFTVSALHRNVLDIPVVGRRARAVIEGAGFPLESYSGQAMLEIIEDLPKTELFASSPEVLAETVEAVHSIGRRRSVRLFVRGDRFERFVSCLIYLPRDRYTTRVRVAMQDALAREFHAGTVEYTARVTESALAMVHVVLRDAAPGHVLPHRITEADRERIEAGLIEISRGWDDRFDDAAMRAGFSPTMIRWALAALPEAYKEDFEALRAVRDVALLDALAVGDVDVRLAHTRADRWRVTVYVRGSALSLGQILPILQSLGYEVHDERPYTVSGPGRPDAWIYDFSLVDPRGVDDGAGADTRRAERVQDAFLAAWRGDAEADRFNELVPRAGLTWRQAAVLRTYAKYLRQEGFPYSQHHIETVALAHPTVAAGLVALFEAYFDPDTDDATREQRSADIDAELNAGIERVVSLDEDRVLRAVHSLVHATVRTNAFVVGRNGARPALAVKLLPREIDELPLPRPQFEIFVCSPDVEGVHLRFGRVARGGLRWSDRREDFRTEILGLAKAQQVKNAVIVPVGAKGGFVVKRPPKLTGDANTDRTATHEAGVAAYRAFVSAMLDVTDDYDRSEGTSIPPQRVVRRDGDDDYLVVAADKGTATFSDLANSIAEDYGYWLGDAFASGGSTGYDHKELGITARGAWKSVERHFREMGLDPATDDFTAVGVGDMSGDVFGNGMLLSEHIRLVAAFDHRHVFLDPDPDAAASFAERSRMFALPRSSWADYDAALISRGGGVWERSVKSIPVSPQARRSLGLADDVTELSPPELVRAILLAPVDLLWNGGIGTYVKARSEANGDVGDKSNDLVRVDGAQVRARVIGEGGNLGVTQLGRIEYARAGGRINTDAIDNSAGVDSSDHEVNIKILLDSAVTDGLVPPDERNPLLASMSDEVADLVLADNTAQNSLLGLSRATAPAMIDVHERLVAQLERERGLDRSLESLPTPEEFAELAERGAGLSSPELATLTAHVKLALEADLLATDLPDSDTFASLLPGYFPTPLRDRLQRTILRHPLRRQIVATMLVGETIDMGGITYSFRLAEDTGAATTDTVRAFAAATAIFGLRDVWSRIRSRGLPVAVEDAMIDETLRLLDRATRWLLARRPQPLAVGAEIARYTEPVAELVAAFPTLERDAGRRWRDRRAAWALEHDAPRDLADEVYGLVDRFAFLDVVDVADVTDRPLTSVADAWLGLEAHLEVPTLFDAIAALDRGGRWHSLARLALRDDVYGSLRQLTYEVLSAGEPGESTEDMIAEWEATNGQRVVRARTALGEIYASDTLDLATLSVAARQVRSMVRGGAAGAGV
ncbi:NAD-glutamate dehydrogenase [Rhodococcus rhodnii]|nr:NAD-glutamate dehydrogenase [Rhodococcus rhodnii]TXG92801.1 NAD-glutamate dehydrogenase [Rhodococcus rhodnii]